MGRGYMFGSQRIAAETQNDGELGYIEKFGETDDLRGSLLWFSLRWLRIASR